MKLAVVYARYSSEKQNDQSIEGQLDICQKYAAQNGLEIVDTYIDRAMSGTNDQRPAFQQMLADCAKPVPWDIILVYAIDRFGRNSIEIAVNKQKIKKNHKTLISATQRTSENIDGSKNLDGILLENMYIGLAEYYSAELSQKVRRGFHENRKKGLFCGGNIIFGYRVENKKILIHEDEAKVVRYIFDQYIRGRQAKDILDELTAKGVMHRNKPIPLNTFYAILRNQKYIGIAHLSDGVYTDMYPPIIPKPLFDEVQIILERNKRGSKSPTTDYLLKGKCICGYCGRNVQAETGTARDGSTRHYYKCGGRKKYRSCNKSVHRKDDLEKLVIEITRQVIGTPENIDLVADAVMEIHEKRNKSQSMLNILLTEQEEAQRIVNNIMKAIEQGILTPTTKTRIEQAEQKLAEIEDKILAEQYKQQNQIKREQVVEFLKHTVWQKPQLMIYTLIQKIVLYDDKIEIYYNYIDPIRPDGPSDDDDHRIFFILDGSNLIRSAAPHKKAPLWGFFAWYPCRIAPPGSPDARRNARLREHSDDAAHAAACRRSIPAGCTT